MVLRLLPLLSTRKSKEGKLKADREQGRSLIEEQKVQYRKDVILQKDVDN